MALRTGPPPGLREEEMVLRPWARVLVTACVLYLLVYCVVEWTAAPLILLGVVMLYMLIRSKR